MMTTPVPTPLSNVMWFPNNRTEIQTANAHFTVLQTLPKNRNVICFSAVLFARKKVQECIRGSGTHYHVCTAYACKIHIKYTNKQSQGRQSVGTTFPLKNALFKRAIRVKMAPVFQNLNSQG